MSSPRPCARRQARLPTTSVSCSAKSSRSSARAGSWNTTTARKFPTVAGLDNLKDWLKKRRLAFSERAAQFGLPAPRGCCCWACRAAARASAPRRRPASGGCRSCGSTSAGFSAACRVERRERAPGDPDGRERGAGDPLDRRDRQGVCRNLGFRGQRRRHRLTSLRHVSDLALRKERPGLRHRHGQRYQPPTAGAAAQRARRRDLLRRPAQRSTSGAKSSAFTSTDAAAIRPVRPRHSGPAERRIQRRRDRGGDHLRRSSTPSATAATGHRHSRRPRRDGAPSPRP